MKILNTLLISLLAYSASAQVGIGTSTPSVPLDIEAADAAIDINNTSIGDDPLIHFQVSGVAKFTIGVDNDDSDKFKIGTTALETGTAVTVQSTGEVGIGTTTPTATLDVDGSAIFNESGAAVDFRVEGDTEANLLFVDASADAVGIGTSAPGARLEVYENVASSVSLRIYNPFDSDPGHDVYTEYGVKSTGANPDFTWSTGIDASDDEKFKFSYATGGWAVPGTGDVMTLTMDGNVGIGTASPTATLDVDGSAIFNESGASVDFRVEGDAQTHLLFVDGSADMVGIGTASPTATLDVDGSAIFNETGNSVDFRVEGLGEANLLFVDGSADRIGIGTATPSEELHIVAEYGHLLVEGENNGASSLVAGVSVKANNYRKAGFTIFDESDAPDFFIGRPYASTNQFDISNDGTSRIRIGSSGNVGIAMTNPSVELDVTGDIEYTGTITDVSDRRLKENFSSIDSVLTKIMKMEGLSYNMINDSTKRREYGVIAQDVQTVFPEMVTIVDPENGYLGVAYIQLVPVLLEATKAQQAIIESQKQEIETIKAEAKAQKSETETIKAEASSSSVETNQKLKETAQKLAALEAKLNALLLLNSQGAILTAEN